MTIKTGGAKDAEWRSGAVVRSGKDWEAIQRVKLDGLARELAWAGDSHVLVVADGKPKLDENGRPTTAGRNLLHVVALTGQKAEVRTPLRDGWWINPVRVAPDGKHFIPCVSVGETGCWKLGGEKPLWSKPGKHGAHFGDGDWVVQTDGSPEFAAKKEGVGGRRRSSAPTVPAYTALPSRSQRRSFQGVAWDCGCAFTTGNRSVRRCGGSRS